MRPFAFAAVLAVFSGPAGAATASFSGSVAAPNVLWTDLTEIALPDFFPGYAPRNGQYRFSLLLSRTVATATILTYDHTSFVYEEWWPGHYWSGGDDYVLEQVMTTASNTNFITGTFTGTGYRAELTSNSRYREWFTSRPIFAYLTVPIDGRLDYTATISGPVPEPATWLVLVAGFGLVGAALRRRRTDGVKFASR